MIVDKEVGDHDKMTMKMIAMGADKSNPRQQSGQCGPVEEGSY